MYQAGRSKPIVLPATTLANPVCYHALHLVFDSKGIQK
jgi:hypothetical protein